MLSLFILITIIKLLFSSDISSWNEFDYNVYLDDKNQFQLFWTEYTNNTIEFGLVVNATGWIALGLSPNSQMPHSDIIFAWVSDDNKIYLQDRYTIDRSYPLYDIQQDITLIFGQEIDGITMIRFSRPKISCDPNKQDLSFNEGTTRILYAYNKDHDPTTEYFDATTIEWHGLNKGSQSLNLDTGIPDTVQLESDVEYFDLINDQVAVPAEDTTYWCKLFKLPVFEKTHHIVKIAPIIDNVEILHHLVTFVCAKALGSSPDNYDTNKPCDYWDYNQPAASCLSSGINYGWAVGGEPLYYPQVAGMPMSGDSYLHYIILQIHYNNPEMKQGLIDSSGIRIYHTPTLRKYDAGLISVGTSVNPYGQFIPPGIHYTKNFGFCTSDCTQAGIKGKDIENGTIYAFGSLLHAHTIAIALNLQQIRDNVELPNLDKNWAYDFNYQQTIMFDEPKEIKAGDAFIMNCYLNSTGRDWITLGGESTSQEMCLGFIYVYPAPHLSECWTKFTYDSMWNWLNHVQNKGYLNGNITDAMQNWDWEDLIWDKSVNNATQVYNMLWDIDSEYKHWQRCKTQNGSWITKFETYNDGIRTVPNGFKEYNDDTVDCNVSIDEIGDQKLSKVAVVVIVVSGIIIVVLVVVFVLKCVIGNKKKDYEKQQELMASDYGKC
eukprot:395854_1